MCLFVHVCVCMSDGIVPAFKLSVISSETFWMLLRVFFFHYDWGNIQYIKKRI